jgi:hypothetical protein
MGSQAVEAASHSRPRIKPVEGSRITSRARARASAGGACILWLFIGAAEAGLGDEGKSRAQTFPASAKQGRQLPGPCAIRSEASLVSQVAETTTIEREILERGREKLDGLAGLLTLAQNSDSAQGTAIQAAESAPAWERKLALEREQERDRAEALARTLTSSLRAELNAVQSIAEAATIKQRQTLYQERDRADTLARELATLRAELDIARIAGTEAAQAIELVIRQTQALEQERDKTSNLAREITFLRAELDVARILVSKAVQAAEEEIKQEQAPEQERRSAENLARELAVLRTELDTARVEAAKATDSEIKQAEALGRERATAGNLALELEAVRTELDTTRIAAWDAANTAAAEIEQKQAVERKLNQQRDRAEVLAQELPFLRSELDAARAATTRVVEAAKIERKRVSETERDKTETLARELASAQKQSEERSRRLATAYAEILQLTEANRAVAAEQNLALARERERADALTNELASVRNQIEAGNLQVATLNASQAHASRKRTIVSPHKRVVESRSTMTEGNTRSPEQTPALATPSSPKRSSALDLPPEAQSTARESAPDLDSKEGSASASAAARSPLDEQRLLARANALLRQADISGARPLLEHALERGSARAAFMLAETYDARVLESWRARGISGDRSKARELYERAQAGGIEGASERIKTLK